MRMHTRSAVLVVTLVMGSAVLIAAAQGPVPPVAPAQAPMPPPTTIPDPPAPGEQGEVPVLTEIDTAEANKPRPGTFQRDDMLKMMVWGHADLTHTARVQEDGNITFPLVGEVPAAGRTAAEIRADVERRFTEGLDNEPMRLHREDIVSLTVWGQPDLNYTATVQMDGRVTLPLIGSVMAEGRTLDEVRTDVTTALSRFFRAPRVSLLPQKVTRSTIANPRVSILPEKLRERYVSVIGEVARPGIYPIAGSMRVLEALALSQYRETGQLNSVVVIRDYKGSPQYTSLRLRDFINRKAEDQNIFLESEDIVIVPKTFIAKVNTFVSNWFVGTRGVFDWWISLVQARYVNEYGKAVERLNDSIFQIN
jgi:polysaccharide biosynthesis/export protein